MRAQLIVALLLALVAPMVSAEAPSHLQRAQEEIRRLSADEATDPLLEQARRAVGGAERAAAAGRPQVAERALDIADAAMALLRVRRARDRARLHARAAARRAEAAEARLAEARRALESTRAQRRAYAASRDAGPADGGADAAP